MSARILTAALMIVCAGVLAACSRTAARPSAVIRTLEAEARPIGRGPGFLAPVRGRPSGRCQRPLGARDAAHVELFAENRVVLVAAGIGVRGPVRYAEGQIAAARCYGALVTLDPTGVVLARSGARLTLATLFREWGEPLSPTRLAGFSATHGARVQAFVDGRRWSGDPRTIPVGHHAEIVLELGPHVPPHRSYTFPPTTRP
jgi:hypothetical protein